MHILINVGKEKILLRSEPKNFELCRCVNRRDINSGKIKQEWVAEKWFGTPEGVLQSLLNMKLKSSDATSLQELKEDLIKFRKELIGHYSTNFTLPEIRTRPRRARGGRDND